MLVTTSKIVPETGVLGQRIPPNYPPAREIPQMELWPSVDGSSLESIM